MRILIVDDEAPARRKLARFLDECRPDAERIEAENGIQALEALESKAPDLVLLDIQMPGMTGIEVVEAFGPDEMPPTIFTTAFDQYAVKAFEHNAADYLLKPFDGERFAKALARAEARSAAKSDLLARLMQDLGSQARLERILVRENDRIVPIAVSEIQWLEADDKYVRIHLDKSQRYIRNTIANLERRLDPAKFARAHRSSIVNLDRVKDLQSLAHGDFKITMKNGDTLALSRRYAKRITDGLIG